MGFFELGVTGYNREYCVPEYHFVIDLCVQARPRVWSRVHRLVVASKDDIGEAIGYTMDPDGVSVRPLTPIK